jgi:hypothetical protein
MLYLIDSYESRACVWGGHKPRPPGGVVVTDTPASTQRAAAAAEAGVPALAGRHEAEDAGELGRQRQGRPPKGNVN